jgi:hypothetical protein
MPQQEYDLIGDIHGHANDLKNLLEKMGYCWIDGCYRHDSRKVIFLGDFIDRGTNQRAVLQTVIPMVRQETALAVMGNHEFNALAFHTEHPVNSGRWLRSRNNKHIQQHTRFLTEYLARETELDDVLDFFWSLPLWLDLDGLRVIHACWEPNFIKSLKKKKLVLPGNEMTKDLLVKACTGKSLEYDAIEALLKGIEHPLPEGQVFLDKDGHERRAVRVAWWKNKEDNLKMKDVAFPPGKLDKETGRRKVKEEYIIGYPDDDKPVFIGHYWVSGAPNLLSNNVACLDYSVAQGGKLVAYRWSGEIKLQNKNFVHVE